MAKTTKTENFINAAEQVLTELGGGPIRSKDLVKTILDKALVPEENHTYFYILKAVKSSTKFNTSKRGWVSLANVVVQEVQPQEVAMEAEDFVGAQEFTANTDTV